MPPVPELICAEYSPALQLRVLGLDVARIAEPILDLGCGAGAALVRELRRLGKEAYGVDRAVDDGPFLFGGDWLDFPLGRLRWGTVISHMGFSSHFLHHHLRPGPAAASYARRYMDVLASLRPGGLFVYAPGLPFLEPLLPPERYAVTRRPVEDLAGGSYDERLRAVVGDSVFYASEVAVLT
jgi:SAM-dependent methyltransferase